MVIKFEDVITFSLHELKRMFHLIYDMYLYNETQHDLRVNQLHEEENYFILILCLVFYLISLYLGFIYISFLPS